VAALPNPNYDDHAHAAVNAWQARIILGGAILIAILAVSLAIVALKPRAAVPFYVGLVDRQTGELFANAHPIAASPALRDWITRKVIERFIQDSRGLTNNVALERDTLTKVYATARGQALKALDDWCQHRGEGGTDAIHQALDGKWTEVDIIRCLRQPEPDTWLVEWKESNHSVHSPEVITTDWQASVRTAVTAEGIFIINLDWSKNADQGAAQ
jgi:type IV secretory pathway TrbF-like protein